MGDLHTFKSHVGRSEDERKILYCEVCEVPCRTPLDLQDHFKGESHKKKERAMMYGGFKVEELERIIQKVKCLTDYVEEKDREPLVGLEYVVEFRRSRMADFDYDCELCGSRSKLVPMIVHLNGLKHRKAYISKHFPFTAKNRDPNEDLFQFLRRMASEIERYRGVKMFRVEPLLKGDPGDSFHREFPESLKRKKRWDIEGSPSDGEPSRKRFSGFEDEYEQIEKIVRAKRVAEILEKVKPLNKAEAIAMQRAKALNKAAEVMNASLENRMKDDRPLAPRGHFEPGESRIPEEGRSSFLERERTARDITPQQKDNQEEWKKFFLGGSSAEKSTWADKNRKKEQPWKSEDRNWPQSSSVLKKQSDEAKKRVEAEKRAEAEKRVADEKRAQAERVARAKSLADALTRGRDGQKSHTAQNQQVQATGGKDSTVGKIDEEKLARAKRVAETITQNKPNLPKPGMSFIGKLKSMQPNKPSRNVTGADPAVKQAIAEKLNQVICIPDAGRPHTSQGTFGSGGNWNRDSQMIRTSGAGYEGSRQMPQDMQRGGMSLEKAFATEKQEHWNPPVHDRESNRGLQTASLRMDPMPWRPAQTMPTAAAPLPDDNVVDILENFLKQSLSQEEPNSFGKGGNWNSEPLMQNKPAQLVTASGTWNLVPMAQKQQIQQAVGQGNWNADPMMQNEKSLRAKFSIYDKPGSPFGSSSLNQLNLQPKSNQSTFLGAQPNSDIRGPGSFSFGNRGFNSEFNPASNISYPNMRGSGPSYSSDKLGMDYKANSMLRNNPSGPGTNLMSDVNSNWQQQVASGPIRDLPDLGTKFTSNPAYPSHGYLSGSASKYSREPEGSAERAPRSSLLGDSYRDGIRDLAPNRVLSQVREMGQNRMAERDAFGLPPDILSKVRGKDVFTAWAILSKLASHHPALERMNISSVVNNLVEMGIVK